MRAPIDFVRSHTTYGSRLQRLFPEGKGSKCRTGRQTDKDSRTLARMARRGAACRTLALCGYYTMPSHRGGYRNTAPCHPTAVDTEIQLRASLIKEVKTTRRALPPASPAPRPAPHSPPASSVPSENNIYLTTADEREDFATPPPYFIFAPLSLSFALS